MAGARGGSDDALTAQVHEEGGAPVPVGMPARPGVREKPILFSAPMVRALLAGKKTQTRRLLNPQPIQSIMDADHWREFNEVVGVGLLPAEAGGERQIGWTWKGTRFMPWPRSIRHMSPYGMPGERLWVRETWAMEPEFDRLKPSDVARAAVEYLADGKRRPPLNDVLFSRGKTRVSIFMPRWASRITLEVTGVRVERVQDISEEDAVAEGVTASYFGESWLCVEHDGRTYNALCEPTDEDKKALLLVKHRPREMMTDARGNYRRLWMEINGLESWDANPWVWVVSFARLA